jgi:triacylglycerol esterase/lipase EstA (alpha/beta hydrolase family)
VWVRLLAGVALLVAGCATPVGVTRVDTSTAYRILTESALSAARPSEPSKAVLRRLGQLDRFEDEPAAVLAKLHRSLALAGDEDRLFALAELSFLHGARTGDRAHFLAGAVYAYALLFPGSEQGVRLPGWDPRLRLAYDLYNEGLARGLAGPPADHDTGGSPPGATGEDLTEVRLEAGTRALPFGTLEVDPDLSGLSWGGYRLHRFTSTTTLEVRGLRNRYRRPGLGAALAASLAPREVSTQTVGSRRLGPYTKVPVTAVLRIEDARASLATGKVRGRLEVYAADQASTVMLAGQPQPLEVDPTAALAYQLEGNPLYGIEIAAFLRAGVVGREIPRDRAHDGLFMLQPYRPGKIPVVLVHGTASSPLRWAELANELQGDPRIRERYQIWMFLYDSGNPIGYSAGLLRTALTATVQECESAGKDPALHRMVVIGHSQGGLLTKLTAIDSGTRFWDNISDKPFEEIDVSPETRAFLRRSVFYTPLPFVKRVIFIATPHRGALMAGNWLGRMAARLVTLPATVVRQFGEAATASGDEKLLALLRRPPTAVDNMNPNHPAIRTLASIPVNPNIPAHSIIAVEGGGPREKGDDGVVAYRSAHIDEAVSEVVVRSSHSVQGHPDAIEEVRRILLEHAAIPEGPRP